MLFYTEVVQDLVIQQDEATAAAVIAIAKSFSIGAQIVGRVEAHETGKKRVTIRSEYGEFEYNA